MNGLGHRHVVELAARPDGGALAAMSWAGPDNDPGATTGELHVIDLETGTARDLGRIGTEARSPVWWQADGGWHLAYLAMPEPFGGDAVYAVDVSAAAPVHRDLTAGIAVCRRSWRRSPAARRWPCSRTGSTPRSTGSTLACCDSGAWPPGAACSTRLPPAAPAR